MPFPQTAQFAICFAPPSIFLSLYVWTGSQHGLFYQKKKDIASEIKKNIKNVIYDYEFWKKAVIIDTKLCVIMCERENWSASAISLYL